MLALLYKEMIHSISARVKVYFVFMRINGLCARLYEKGIGKLTVEIHTQGQSRSPSMPVPQVKGGHSSGEIELIHVGFPT
jgi:hypothetical protein